ncbi:MAG: argininosuccinate synthase [Chloroflexi bacterium]|nr:argininosuccinate synthase [Chloroflexota bacterium]
MKQTAKKIILAYSGGLDTSVILHWLKANHPGAEVITVTADVGMGNELDGLEEKAKKTGASKAYILDVREEFITDYIYPTLRAGAVYERKYLLGTSFARPLIAKKMVEIAEKEGADAVAHGATGRGNDQVRFDMTVMALNPRLQIIVPWREWSLKSRKDLLDYCDENGIPTTASRTKIYSHDKNLFHYSTEGGLLENPWNEPVGDGIFEMTMAPEKAPDQATMIDIDFEEGYPTKVNGREMQPVQMMDYLNKVGGENGIGRVDLVENRLVGMKSHGIYETPGGTILVEALRDLETLTLDRDSAHFKEVVALRYAELVYYGQWFTPLRAAIDAFVNVLQKRTTGTVKLKLYKGNVTPVARKAPRGLYREDYASFDDEEVYNQHDAEGFIRLFGLPMKIRALVDYNMPAIDEVEMYSRFKRD